MAVFGKGFLTGQESVELDQQSGVRVLRLGSLAVARTDVVVIKVDTHISGILSDNKGKKGERLSKGRLVVVSQIEERRTILQSCVVCERWSERGFGDGNCRGLTGQDSTNIHCAQNEQFMRCFHYTKARWFLDWLVVHRETRISCISMDTFLILKTIVTLYSESIA